MLPWEDVFTGLALTRSVAAVSAAYVHMGSRVAGESYGIYSKVGFGHNTILFHANTKSSRSMERYTAMHRWALKHHCDSGMPARSATLRCDSPELKSCTGTRWKRCLYVHNYTACPQSGPKWRGTGTSTTSMNHTSIHLGRASKHAIVSQTRSQTVSEVQGQPSDIY